MRAFFKRLRSTRDSRGAPGDADSPASKQHRLRRHARSRSFWFRAFAATVLSLAGVVVLYGIGPRFVPLPPELFHAPAPSISLLDRNGIPLRQARRDENFRREIELSEVPLHVHEAILTAEDKRFFQHRGVDWIATARAVTTALGKGRIESGASTITQQLVKISLRHERRTVWTKLQETVIALRLEQIWTKEQILAAYLNRVDFGNLNIGIASAADYYFRKPLAHLSEAEGAMLAALPKNPRRLNPHTNFAAARQRQLTILRRLCDQGKRFYAGSARAMNERISLQPPRRLFRAPHFVDLVLSQALPDPGGRGKPGAPAEIRTTLDLPLNEQITRIVHHRVSLLREENVRNAAVVVIDNQLGNVIGLIGSEDYFAPGVGQVNGAWARRSAGSTLKPFTYLLAFERGATPATVVADVRTSFPARDGFYRPENYNRRCYGPVSYRTALANSLNIAAVKVLLHAGGPEALHRRLRQVGLSTLEHSAETYGLGLTLGNCEARLLELTNAYAALARLGEYRPWRLSESTPTNSQRIASREHAWLLADILSDNASRALAFGLNSALRFPYRVACKTGTSTDFRDNWTIGYTPEFTVGVWVGNFDGSPMHEVSGVTGAAPILHDVFDHLRARFGTSWYERPERIQERHVHPLTGKLMAGDSRAVSELFLELPEAEAVSDYDSWGRAILPPAYASWYASAENALRERAVVADEFEIAAPRSGTTFLVDPDIASTKRIPLAARGGTAIRWRSASLRCVDDANGAFAVAEEGEHEIVATDEASGRALTTRIVIRSL